MLPVTMTAITEIYRTSLLSLDYLSVSKVTLHNTYQVKSYTFKSWNLYGKTVLERAKLLSDKCILGPHHKNNYSLSDSTIRRVAFRENQMAVLYYLTCYGRGELQDVSAFAK
jgi:hypothetical protein